MQHICSTHSLTVGQCDRELLSRYSSAEFIQTHKLLKLKHTGDEHTHTTSSCCRPQSRSTLCLRSEEDGRITPCVCRDVSPDQGFKPSTSLKSSITHILHAAPPTHHPPPSPPLHLLLLHDHRFSTYSNATPAAAGSVTSPRVLRSVKRLYTPSRQTDWRLLERLSHSRDTERRRIKEYVYPKMKVQSSSFPPLHLLDNLNKQIQIIQCWNQSGPLTSNMGKDVAFLIWF